MRISDWSSDVCSSDLNAISGLAAHRLGLPGTALPGVDHGDASHIGVVSFPGGNAAILRMMLARMIPGAIAGDGRLAALASGRSEERRVGKECVSTFRSRWSP